jgi:hypothetical protein
VEHGGTEIPKRGGVGYVLVKTRRDKIRDYIADRIADIIIGAVVLIVVGLYLYWNFWPW